jgi:hypothetical protein
MDLLQTLANTRAQIDTAAATVRSLNPGLGMYTRQTRALEALQECARRLAVLADRESKSGRHF